MNKNFKRGSKPATKTEIVVTAIIFVAFCAGVFYFFYTLPV